MDGDPPFAKRRHILSSFNQDRPIEESARRNKEDANEGTHEHGVSPRTKRSPPSDPVPKDADGDPLRPRKTRLKLKKHRHRRRSRSRSDPPRLHDGESGDHTTGDRHRHRRRHHRRRRSPTPPNIHEAPPLDPEAAFRESLFDAMADDEAALYWESVYGQPLHIYSNERVGPQGELERMTEEEYAAHVRQKMFEKTHAGILEEQARREERRRQREQVERERRRTHDREDKRQRELHGEMERSLRRGRERRERKTWAGLWDRYTAAWATWDGDAKEVPWPVRDGERKSIDDDNVRTFLVHGLNLREVGESAFAAKLRDERVRWHPDKIQQRLGGRVDSEVMKDVTAIFQIIDRLWGEMRANKK
ncbi:hypothetical protein JDV02_007490 [Purpureocillium takamizusanense]|uniref:Uncharacterized protein n=1 Tax=Purpureocillium takamizusanense TaxID=2060973 RepID=A0A9Q8QLT7_9HYPO|nr:uncharacterized protein JDV02_007490 [Purpureocillium takamizusanense]UNI21506.1 hypothetical protein JDV02_007490 [Purpureocillium takamizusanense]